MCVSFHFSSLNLCTVLFFDAFAVHVRCQHFTRNSNNICMFFFVYDVRFLNCAFLFYFWFRGKKARVAHSMCRKKFILFLNLHSVLSCHTIFGTVFISFLTPYSHAAIFVFPFHVKTCVEKKPSHQFVWQNIQLKGLLNWKTDDGFEWNVWDLAARIIFVNIFSRRRIRGYFVNHINVTVDLASFETFVK